MSERGREIMDEKEIAELKAQFLVEKLELASQILQYEAQRATSLTELLDEAARVLRAAYLFRQ